MGRLSIGRPFFLEGQEVRNVASFKELLNYFVYFVLSHHAAFWLLLALMSHESSLPC